MFCLFFFSLCCVITFAEKSINTFPLGISVANLEVRYFDYVNILSVITAMQLFSLNEVSNA